MAKKTNDVLGQSTLSENEINLIKNRASRDPENVYNSDTHSLWADEYEITPDQSIKGLKWLDNLYHTPKTGSIRKNNPFTPAQVEIIGNFDRFTFIGLTDCGNGFVHWYMPIYRVYAKNGSYFDYHLHAGTARIINNYIKN